MGPEVFGEGAAVGEGLVAVLTRVGPFAGVCPKIRLASVNYTDRLIWLIISYRKTPVAGEISPRTPPTYRLWVTSDELWENGRLQTGHSKGFSPV